MIQVTAGDLIAIQKDDFYAYALVVTNIKLFGGNIVYGFHRTTKELINSEDLLNGDISGFLAFVDLIWAKRNGVISKIDKKIERPYAYDAKRYRQIWPTKGANGYHIKIIDEYVELIDEFKVTSKNDISQDVLLLPEFECMSIDRFFERISSQWHQSKIEATSLI